MKNNILAFFAGSTDLVSRGVKLVVTIAVSVLLFSCGSDGTTDLSAPALLSFSPGDGETGVAFDAVVTAQFDEDLDPSTVSAAIVSLSSGAGPVEGTFVYDAGARTATFSPTAPLEDETEYTVVVGSLTDSTGNAFPGASWTFTTLDIVSPALVGTTPENGDVDLDVDIAVTASFDEAIDETTLDNTSFTLVGANAGSVTGVVDFDVNTLTATFTPDANLEFEEVYTATLSSAITDDSGNALTESSWSFTTMEEPDTTAPDLTSNTPADGATDVAIDSVLTAVFDEALAAATVNGASFTLIGETSGAVAGSVSYDPVGFVATFTPSGDLDNDDIYTATLSNTIRDLSGNAYIGSSWTFTTVALPPDLTSPSLIATSPIDGDTDVSLTTSVEATFDEALDATTLTNASFSLVGATSGAVSGTVGYNAGSFTATFTPDLELDSGETYTATLGAGITDVAGNPFAGGSWSFTTLTNVSSLGIMSRSPDIDEIDVSVTTTVEVVFNGDADGTTIDTTSFVLQDELDNPVAGMVGYNAPSQQATFAPDRCLDAATGYSVTLTTGILDDLGDPFAGDTWDFDTGSGWGDATAVDDDADSASGVSVASDGSDTAVAVWLQSATGDSTIDVVASFFNVAGCAWSTPVIVDANELVDASGLSLGMASNGTAIATWLQDIDGDAADDVVSAIYDPVNGIWGAPAALDTNMLAATGASVAVASSGDAVAVWLQDTDGAMNGNVEANASVYDPTAGLWGAPATLDTAGAPIQGVTVDIDVNGNAVAVWTQGGGTVNLWASIYDGTSWSAADNGIESGAADVANAVVYVNETTGNAIATYEQDASEDINMANDSNTNAEAFAVIYDAIAGTWGTPEFLDDDGATLANAAVVETTGIIDELGNAYVVWRQGPGGSESVNASVFDPLGGTWTDRELLESSGDQATEVRLSFDSNGAPIAYWAQSGNIISNTYSLGSWQDTAALTTIVDEGGANDAAGPAITFGSGIGGILVWLRDDGAAIDDVYGTRNAD